MTTQEKILRIARLEFANNGLEGARVDRIAENAGVNKAMIYYHFRSKDDLYQAVINEHMEQIANFLQRNIMEAGEYDNLFLRISEFLHALLKDRKEFMPIMLREIASGGERIKTALTSLISEKGITKSIREIIEAGINEGRFREIDSKQAIISFLGMNIFYLILAPAINAVWEIEDEQDFRKRRPQAIADLFLHGLEIK